MALLPLAMIIIFFMIAVLAVYKDSMPIMLIATWGLVVFCVIYSLFLI